MENEYENIIICPYYNQCHDEEDILYYDNNPTSLFKIKPEKRCLQYRHDGRDKINKTLKRRKKHVCNVKINKKLSWKEARETFLAERNRLLKDYYLIDYIIILNIIEQKMKEEN